MTAATPRPSPRLLWSLVAAALAWRVLICVLTPIPSEDGVNRLWMAERFAAGDFRAPLGEVFPPLLPLLAAPWIALGVSPFAAAQAVLTVCGALAVVPIARASDRALPGSGTAAAWLVAFAHLPVRFAAEVYGEPLFVLLAACAIERGLARRWWGLGICAGLAFWVRPEAVLVVLGFALWAPRRSAPAWLPLAASVLALALWRAVAGFGFDPLPRLAFNWERTVATDSGVLPALARFGSGLLQLPWLGLEAFAVLGALAYWGMLRTRRPAWKPLGTMLALGAALIAAFLPRRRFLVPWLPAITPFAAAGLGALPRRSRTPVLAIAVVVGLALSLHTTEPDRIAEREVGAWLASQLAPAQTVAGDMTRVVYYAGCRPLPPRRWTTEDLVRSASDPAVQFVVLQRDRTNAEPTIAALAGKFSPITPPPALAPLAEQRGIVVLARR